VVSKHYFTASEVVLLLTYNPNTSLSGSSNIFSNLFSLVRY